SISALSLLVLIFTDTKDYSREKTNISEPSSVFEPSTSVPASNESNNNEEETAEKKNIFSKLTKNDASTQEETTAAEKNSSLVTFNDINRVEVPRKYATDAIIAQHVFQGELQSYHFSYPTEKEMLEFAEYLYKTVYVFIDDIDFNANDAVYNEEYYKESLYIEDFLKNTVPQIVKSDMTQIDAATAIHDWIIANYSYDYSLQIRSVKDFLKQKTGVCQAYTNLYMIMCRYVGIDCSVVRGSAVNNGVTETHSWNKLIIDGKEYYTDITWNDCLNRKAYFMMSESEISADHTPKEYCSNGIYSKLNFDYYY
ncbi:MAG: transglutaminase-like domain-containing protein, partial [Clostridiales bacterium]|nr:transglutaminase-like domain-containing protein [Clostridiales bacterium]